MLRRKSRSAQKSHFYIQNDEQKEKISKSNSQFSINCSTFVSEHS